MRAASEGPITGEGGQAAGSPLSLYAIAACGALGNVLRSLHEHTAAGTLWMDPYWVNFYLTRYEDGYRRRALMGTVLSHLRPGAISIVALNALAAVVLVVALALFFRALCGMVAERRTAWSRVFLFALAASTLTAVFYETLGDLLQVCLVVATGAAMVAARVLRGETMRLLVLLPVMCVCFLLHEASVFLLAPALPFLLKARPRVREFVLPVVLLAVLLGVSVHWSGRIGWPTYPVVLLNGHRLLAEPGATPALRWNLIAESQAYFGTPAARLYFAGRFPRVLVMGLAYVLVVVNCLPRRLGVRALSAFAVITLGSLPLWVIAVDWGRFLSYAFVLAVVATWLWGAWTPMAEDPAPARMEALQRRLEWLNGRPLLRWGVVFVLLAGPLWPATHIDPMPLWTSLSFCALAGLALVLPSPGLPKASG